MSVKVMVLAGGPDRERAVSLMSGAEVAVGLQQAGHEIIQRDIGPGKLESLEEFVAWGGEVIFPVLHGAWGEGGPLQRILEQKRLKFVGCRSSAAELGMDKVRTKEVWSRDGLPTPRSEVIERVAGGQLPGGTLEPPVVVKPPCEGSSIDVAICHDKKQLAEAMGRLGRAHDRLMVEQFVAGKELTVGLLERPGEQGGGVEALPVLEIVPTTSFYDYDAKYQREDTQYRFDPELPGEVLRRVEELAVRAHEIVGCRHLSRVDVIVDKSGEPWLLEINTMPGFTSHSLVPKAAGKAGVAFYALVDRLARLGMSS
ncbi:MAG: D-alanine--D-alanine ligase [Phycisphaeraceae bacterium]|nr:D-alanine--D-alanine ligase [Phycisphaeraceae bacterium]